MEANRLKMLKNIFLKREDEPRVVDKNFITGSTKIFNFYKFTHSLNGKVKND